MWNFIADNWGWILIAWMATSVPASLFLGRFIALARRENKEELITFGYPCQACGKGTVQRTVREITRPMRGCVWTISDAVIGVCDLCGGEHFSAKETKRWEALVAAREATGADPETEKH